MADKNPKSSVDNHSKGTGGAFKSKQGEMGSEYNQAHNDKVAEKLTGIECAGFNETMNSTKKPTQS